ncbi:MAG: hypothetical protein MZV65_21115 [Chromatiales bacterium]|nr:hypothetical protein [Chromatiales bacterium]
MWRKPPRGNAADLPDGLQGKPPAVCLVGDGGIGKAVAENDLPRLEGGPDHGIGVLGPGRCEEEDLRLARDVESSLVEQDLADSLPSGVPPGSWVMMTGRPFSRRNSPASRIWVVFPDPSTPSKVMNHPAMTDRHSFQDEQGGDFPAALTATKKKRGNPF